MEYTIADLLQSGMLSGYAILGKVYDYSEFVIHHVSVQEMPVDPALITEGELILSTGAGCLDNPAAMREMLKRLSLSKAAGVVFAFPDASYQMPEDILGQAAKSRLPLFCIPWSIKFRDLVSNITARIKTAQLAPYDALRSDLYNAYFKMADLKQAAELICRHLSADVLIFDSFRELLAQSFVHKDAAAEKAAGSLSDYPDDCIYPIHMDRQLAGYLVLTANTDAGYPSPHAGIPDAGILSEYVSFPLSLWFSRRSIEDMMQNRLRNDFIQDLANGECESYEEMLRQGARFHLALDKPHTCIVMRAVEDPEPAMDRDPAKEAALSLELENQLQNAVTGQGFCAHISSRLEYIIYYVNHSSASQKHVRQFLKSLQEQISAVCSHYSFFFGVSEISRQAPDYHELYTQAAMALRRCLDTAGPGESEDNCYYFTYMDIREARILRTLEKDEELRKEAAAKIEVLKNYGKTDTSGAGIDLAGTVSAYIRSNYNISETARRLHIHRQSLLYRLSKIEELTEMSLSSHQDLFLLEIYLRLSSAF